MRKCAFALGILLGVLGSHRASAQALDCNADFAPGRVLVRFKATATAGAQQEAHAAAGALQVLREFDGAQVLQLVEVTAGQEQAAISVYQNDSGVEYAEPVIRDVVIRT